jgi:hypothetical protein
MDASFASYGWDPTQVLASFLTSLGQQTRLSSHACRLRKLAIEAFCKGRAHCFRMNNKDFLELIIPKITVLNEKGGLVRVRTH